MTVPERATGSATTRPSGSRWAAAPGSGLGAASSSVVSSTTTRPSATLTSSARLRASSSDTVKRAGSGPAERTARQRPASPAPTRSTPAFAAWSRARNSLSWTTTSPARIAGQGRRARRRRGGVDRRGLAGRVAARGVGDRLAAVGGAVAIQARQLGVGEGPAVRDGHERQQRLDRRQAPDPLRRRARAAPARGRSGAAGPSSSWGGSDASASCAARLGRRASRAPSRGGRSTSAAGRSRRRTRRSPGRSSTGSAADRRRAARSSAKTSRSSAAHSVASARGERSRRSTAPSSCAAAACALRGAQGTSSDAGGGDRRAAGGRGDHQAAVGLRGHVDAGRGAREVQDHPARALGAIAVTLSTASADGWRQRSETVSPGCSGSALASRAMPRPDGWSPSAAPRRRWICAARSAGSQARATTYSPPASRHASGRSARVSGAAPAGAASASEARAPTIEAHRGACHARERAPVPIARLSSGAVRTVVLTISTSVSRREAEDLSGPLLAHLAEEAGRRDRGDGGRARRLRAHRGPPAPLRRRRRDASSSPPAAPA